MLATVHDAPLTCLCESSFGLISRSLDEFIPASAVLTDVDAVYSNGDGLARLRALITSNVAYKFVPALAPQAPAASVPEFARVEPDRSSLRVPGYPRPALPAPSVPFVGPGFVGGFPSGPSSLVDPLFVGGIAGGGLFVGPDSGLFGSGPQFQPPFGEGMLPGARFDPYGPPGPGIGPDGLPLPGQGRGRGRTPPFSM